MAAVGLVAGLTIAPPLWAQANGAAPPLKVIRYAFRVAESGFDPAQITDLYSRTVAASIYDAPYEYEFMAKPARIRPSTAAAMPEVSADFKTFTIRIKPGIYFADDPAFKGVKRELTAEDYVYSVKRHYDPRWKSGGLYVFENAKILGLSELRKKLLAEKKPFDYDTPVEGLRTLDRYTFQVRLAEPGPRFASTFADGSFTGAVAREVVEFYGDKINEHPVGTGPFRLAAWKRSSRMVLAKNPTYREVFYDETPPAGSSDNARRLQAVAQQYKGKRLPLIDEVHIAIIEENQPRWLSFLNEEADILEELPADFATVAIPNNRLAPHLTKKGIQMVRYPRADVAVSYFGMENPVVGGYEPQKVALRRAISLAVDVDREIRLVRRGQAIPAQGPIAPETTSYDPKFKSTMGDFDRGRAKALLDLHGYVDKDGDGWREQPDGQPLVLEYATQPDQNSRQLTELWKKNMDAIGIRMVFKPAKWPENLKAARSGKLMMWGVGSSASGGDGQGMLTRYYGPQAGNQNLSRFRLKAFDDIHDRLTVLPDGPERLALFDQAKRLAVAYAPYKLHCHRYVADMMHPKVVGYRRPLFWNEWWHMVDADPAARPRSGRVA